MDGGRLDFIRELEQHRIDICIVNEDGDSVKLNGVSFDTTKPRRDR